jgi:hypothetical protein
MCPLSEIILSTGFYLIQIPSRNKLNAKLDLASGSINPGAGSRALPRWQRLRLPISSGQHARFANELPLN